VLSSIRVWPSPGNFWVLAALVIAALAWWRGRLVIGLLLGLALVLVAGVLLAVRVPVFSGIGDRSYTEVHSKYTLGVGRLEIDLGGAQLPKGETFVKATLGIGALRIRGAGTPRHPDAVRGTHGGIERGDEAARRLPHLDGPFPVRSLDAPMLIRLPVGEHNECAIVQEGRQLGHESPGGRQGRHADILMLCRNHPTGNGLTAR